MPTPGERSALLFVAAVAAFGLGVRGCRALRPAPPPPAAREALAAQLAAVDSVIAAGGRSRAARSQAKSDAGRPATRPRAAPEAPPAARGPIDIDRASAEELDALPGIGPALAARIIADRDQGGPFGSLEGFQRVKGIGPALAGRLRPLVTFSGVARHPPAASRSGNSLHP